MSVSNNQNPFNKLYEQEFPNVGLLQGIKVRPENTNGKAVFLPVQLKAPKNTEEYFEMQLDSGEKCYFTMRSFIKTTKILPEELASYNRMNGFDITDFVKGHDDLIVKCRNIAKAMFPTDKFKELKKSTDMDERLPYVKQKEFKSRAQQVLIDHVVRHLNGRDNPQSAAKELGWLQSSRYAKKILNAGIKPLSQNGSEVMRITDLKGSRFVAGEEVGSGSFTKVYSVINPNNKETDKALIYTMGKKAHVKAVAARVRASENRSLTSHEKKEAHRHGKNALLQAKKNGYIHNKLRNLGVPHLLDPCEFSRLDENKFVALADRFDGDVFSMMTELDDLIGKRQLLEKLVEKGALDEEFDDVEIEVIEDELMDLFDSEEIPGEFDEEHIELIQEKINELKEKRGAYLEILVYVLKDISETLAAMHKNGYVHGDLKGENVLYRFVEDNGNHTVDSRVIDFGATTLQGNFVCGGTEGYCSPEIWKQYFMGGEVIPTEYSHDIWSLGMILDYILTVAANTEMPEMSLGEMIAIGADDCFHQHSSIQMEGIKSIDDLTESQKLLCINLWNLKNACLAINPEIRPTAEQLVKYFKDLLASGIMS